MKKMIIVFSCLLLVLVFPQRAYFPLPSELLSAHTLRVVVPAQERLLGLLTPYGPGFESELLELFAQKHGYSFVWLEAKNMYDAVALLDAGQADLAVGFADAHLNAASMQEEIIALGKNDITVGPAYKYSRPMRVHLASVALPTMSPEFTVSSPWVPSVSDATPWLSQESYALAQPFMPSLRGAEQSTRQIPHHWLWRADRANLAANVVTFWEDIQKTDTLMVLQDRYFGFVAKTPSVADADLLREIIATRLGKYAPSIRRAAEAFDIDPLLLVALIHQESRFDPNAVSYTGVRGIMQLTTATAAHLEVDRLNPERAIWGGAKYLRQIWDKLEEQGSSKDRWAMVLAAYNQGPGSLQGAMRRSERSGVDADSWSAVKRAYPGLRNEGGAVKKVRGHEAVQFVEQVRYNYYLLNGFIALGRPEAEHLAALFPSS